MGKSYDPGLEIVYHILLGQYTYTAWGNRELSGARLDESTGPMRPERMYIG